MTPTVMAGVCALATLLTWIGVATVRRVAERRLMLDLPNERSLHTRPVPRGGGLALVIVCLGALFTLRHADMPSSSVLTDWVLLGGAVVAAVSWVDDLRSLSPISRFAAHLSAAALALVAVGACRIVEVPLLGVLSLAWLGPPLALIWLVGLTNAYNFMDGIDGLAAGQGIVAGLGWFLLPCGDAAIRWLGLALAGSCLGFLLHNWQPARIFMGDVGSAFLGYMLATMAAVSNGDDRRFATVGVLLVWPFIFDTSFTFFRRLGRGENVFAAHRTHLYQRLVIAGRSHQFVSLLYMVLAASGVGLARVWLGRGRGSEWLVVGGLLAGGIGLWAFVLWTERLHAASAEPLRAE